MSYLAKWVSEVKEGETITAADVEVLARVHQALLASDKHHQQARDAQANVAEKLVVNAAVALAEAANGYNHLRNSSGNYAKRQAEMYKVRVGEAAEDLCAAVAHLLAVSPLPSYRVHEHVWPPRSRYHRGRRSTWSCRLSR